MRWPKCGNSSFNLQVQAVIIGTTVGPTEAMCVITRRTYNTDIIAQGKYETLI